MAGHYKIKAMNLIPEMKGKERKLDTFLIPLKWEGRTCLTYPDFCKLISKINDCCSQEGG